MNSKWKGIVGRKFRPQEFKDYVGSLVFSNWRPQFVVVHNTSEPRLSQWHSTPGEQRMLNLEDYYKNQMNWSAGPHLFVADDFIWVFTPLTTSGVHSPSWNAVSWGVEMVGEYQQEAFSPAVRENAVDALAVLHSCRGLDPHNLRFHKEDPRTTHKECPGIHVDKADLIARVIERMTGPDDGEHLPDRLAGGAAPASPSTAVTTPAAAAPAPAVALPKLSAGAGTVVAAAAATPGGGIAVEMALPVAGQPPAATPTTGTGPLHSKLLSGDPVLQQVAAGDLVLVQSNPPARQAGVGILQDALNWLSGGNPAFAVDLGGGRFRGFYGEKTAAAVRAFQTAQGIGVDGKTGEHTILRLDAAMLALEAGNTAPAQQPAPAAKPASTVAPAPNGNETVSATPAAPTEKETVLDASVTIFKLKDRSGFFFQGRLEVDSDGSPHCYHPPPDEHLGLDVLADATSNSMQYIQGQNGVGPAEGFYVSQTSLQSGPDNRCDSFVDAETIPYMVFYGRRKFPDLSMGDVGMVVSLLTGKRTHVIIGDGNNGTKGEVSMRTAQNLGVNSSPKYGGDDHFNYVYLMFPDTRFDPVNPPPHWPDDKIKEVAEEAFAKWGGMDVLRQHFPHIPAGAA